MSQYKKGVISLTTASNVVTGDGTQEFLTNVAVGNILTVDGFDVSYEVAHVTNDNQFELNAPWANPDQDDVMYRVTRSFTPQFGIPYIEEDDIDTHIIFRRAVFRIEEILSGEDVPIEFASGTLANPGAFFSEEPGLGFYRPALNELGVAVNGIQTAKFTTNGIVTTLEVAAATVVTTGTVTSAGTLNANAVGNNVRIRADGTSAKDAALEAASDGTVRLRHWGGTGQLGLFPSGRWAVSAGSGTLVDDGANALQVVGSLAVSDVATTRTNLGVTGTGVDTTYAYRANNLSDLANAGTARTNLGVTATGADTAYAFRANNLSDLASAVTARTNLGLGSIATQAANAVAITGGTISGLTSLVGASNILEILSGTIAQKLRVYGTTTGSKYFQIEHNGTNAILSTTAGILSFSQRSVFGGTTDDGTTALQVIGGALVSDTITSTKAGLILSRSGSSTAAQYLTFANTSGQVLLGVSGSTGTDIIATGGTAYAVALASPNALPVQLGVNGTVRLQATNAGAAVTGDAYFTGHIAVGYATVLSTVGILFAGEVTGGTDSAIMQLSAEFTPAAGNSCYGIAIAPLLRAGTYTQQYWMGIRSEALQLGAGVTCERAVSVRADEQTVGTIMNRSFYSPGGINEFIGELRLGNHLSLVSAMALRGTDLGGTFRRIALLNNDNHVYLGAVDAPNTNGNTYLYAKGASAGVFSDTGLVVVGVASDSFTRTYKVQGTAWTTILTIAAQGASYAGVAVRVLAVNTTAGEGGNITYSLKVAQTITGVLNATSTQGTDLSAKFQWVLATNAGTLVLQMRGDATDVNVWSKAKVEVVVNAHAAQTDPTITWA